jgi:HEAT repeat-containing protein 5
VLHLSELVRMAFIAATSDSDKLRLAGLAGLQVIFSNIIASAFSIY